MLRNQRLGSNERGDTWFSETNHFIHSGSLTAATTIYRMTANVKYESLALPTTLSKSGVNTENS